MFDFIAFIRKRWSEVSEFSGQKGTPIDELAVKPAGIILSEFQNRLASERRTNDLSRWREMSEAELQRFGKKFFMPWEEGGFASGSVRVYANHKSDILIKSNTAAVSADGYRFLAVDPGTISASAFRPSDQRFALYYIDIPVRAAMQGDIYNIDANTISALENVDFSYVTATNPAPMTRGSKADTKEEYYNRLVYSLHDGSMMNPRSVSAVLKQFFPLITRIYIAGAGDRYMVRDLVSGSMIDNETKLRSFLGKIPGDNTIRNYGYYGTFPYSVGSERAAIHGPFSWPSEYEYPLTISPSETTVDDPAFYGYELEKEAASEDYHGLYFDDFSRAMSVQTQDLFNILDENLGPNGVVSPGNDWVYGANGYGVGDFSALHNNEDVHAIDLVRFAGNEIRLGSGALSPIAVAKDIGKRAGLKLTGSFVVPEIDSEDSSAYESAFQIMVGGVNDNSVVDAFTGVGFGVAIHSEYLGDGPGEENANVFFAHSEKYGDGNIFAYTDDQSSHNFDSMLALHNLSTWIEPGQEYEFEFVIDDNFKLSLYLNKVNQGGGNGDTISTETTKMMNIYGQQYGDKNSSRYGTTMKASVDTKALPGYFWSITNLKVFDIAPKRANTLYVFNVDNMESPVDVLFRGSASGSVNGVLRPGHSVYIWDKEKQTPASGSQPLTNGGWTQLSGVSDAAGVSDTISNVVRQNLNSIERYAVESRFGNAVILMVTSTGTSEAKIRYSGQTGDDIHSEVVVDYVAIESASRNMYHTNNVADIYVVTEKNAESFDTVSATLTKSGNDTYFVMDKSVAQMPVSEIVSVSIGEQGVPTQVLSDSDYSVVRADRNRYNSVDEEIRIFVIDETTDSIVVEYRQYKDVANIQSFYLSSQYAKIFGGVLVKHKIPVYLSVAIVYYGVGSQQQVVDAVLAWVDDNIDGTFGVSNLITHLYDTGFVTGVQQPLQISYQGINDLFEPVSGSFSDQLKIRDVEFFKIDSLSVQKQ